MQWELAMQTLAGQHPPNDSTLWRGRATLCWTAGCLSYVPFMPDYTVTSSFVHCTPPPPLSTCPTLPGPVGMSSSDTTPSRILQSSGFTLLPPYFGYYQGLLLPSLLINSTAEFWKPQEFVTVNPQKKPHGVVSTGNDGDRGRTGHWSTCIILAGGFPQEERAAPDRLGSFDTPWLTATPWGLGGETAKDSKTLQSFDELSPMREVNC